MTHKKQSFSLHLHLLLCKITANVLLFLSWAECAHQHQQRSQAWPFLLTVNHAMWSGTGRKRKNEGIKILDEEPGVLPAQSVHLLSPAGWSNQHTTLRRQAATPGTATQFGVPSQPACSQSLFFSIFVWQHEGLVFMCLYFTEDCL